jgi:20S proteasome subunit alpha 2
MSLTPRRFLPWTIGSFCFALLQFPNALASTNYNVYNYDVAPTFTPDGRLLQVEYASVASELSAPLLAIQAEDETLILMTVKNVNTPQNRIVIVPVHSDGKRQEASRICVAMSGVLADSIALIQVGLKETSEQYRRYRTPMSVLQLAIAMANACQSHSFGGGIRPFGCTLLTCGFSSTGSLCMYQTDPSGAIMEAPATGAPPSTPCIRWVVGGNSAVQRKVRKRLDASLSKSKKGSSISALVASVGKVLLKETQKEQGDGGSADPSQGYTSLEVVVINRKLGCYRLSNAQISSIMR